jgi:hypothetical protein
MGQTQSEPDPNEIRHQHALELLRYIESVADIIDWMIIVRKHDTSPPPGLPPDYREMRREQRLEIIDLHIGMLISSLKRLKDNYIIEEEQIRSIETVIYQLRHIRPQLKTISRESFLTLFEHIEELIHDIRKHGFGTVRRKSRRRRRSRRSRKRIS